MGQTTVQMGFSEELRTKYCPKTLLSIPYRSKVLEPCLPQAEAFERPGGIRGEEVNPYCSQVISPQISS